MHTIKFFCLLFPGNLLPPGLLRALHQVCPKKKPTTHPNFRTSTTASIKITSVYSVGADASASGDPEQQHHHQPQLLPPSSRRASSYILPQATNATTDLGDMSQHLPLEALEPPPPYKVVLASEEPPPSELNVEEILSL